MQDYRNDPPDYDELPDWYMTLEDALTQGMPQDVANAVRKTMDSWVEEYNKKHEIEPIWE